MQNGLDEAAVCLLWKDPEKEQIQKGRTDLIQMCFCSLSDGGGEEEGGGQQPHHVNAAALVNDSPKMPGGEGPGAVQQAAPSRPECFDVTLHRKDTEGFGFVILTSKNKPPPGGQERTKLTLK